MLVQCAPAEARQSHSGGRFSFCTHNFTGRICPAMYSGSFSGCSVCEFKKSISLSKLSSIFPLRDVQQRTPTNSPDLKPYRRRDTERPDTREASFKSAIRGAGRLIVICGLLSAVKAVLLIQSHPHLCRL